MTSCIFNITETGVFNSGSQWKQSCGHSVSWQWTCWMICLCNEIFLQNILKSFLAVSICCCFLSLSWSKLRKVALNKVKLLKIFFKANKYYSLRQLKNWVFQVLKESKVIYSFHQSSLPLHNTPSLRFRNVNNDLFTHTWKHTRAHKPQASSLLLLSITSQICNLRNVVLTAAFTRQTL